MRNLLLATAAVAALTFVTSTASADHYNRRPPGCYPSATPYQVYRQSTYYSNRYNAYRSPYNSPYRSPYSYGNYGRYGNYGYPGYSRNSFGVQGQNFSFRIGF